MATSCFTNFGTYNDYGALEDIEKNKNTELIESYFDCTIEDFCSWFTEETTYQRGDVSEEQFKNFEEMKDLSFMWIDRKVYDFMSTYVSDAGHLDFGNAKILELIGFKRDGNSEDKRYKEKWVFEDKILYSDGNYIQKPDQGNIFYFNDPDYSYGMSSYINIPEDKKWIGTKSMNQLWEHLDDSEIKKMFMPILTGNSYNDMEDILYGLYDDETLSQTYRDKYKELRKPKSIVDYYKQSIREFGNEFSEICTLSNNLHPMSATFEPYILYLTPQCGEFREHQVLLDKFSEINKSKTREE